MPGARRGGGRDAGERGRRRRRVMNAVLLAEIYVFVLAVFVGFEVISKVPVVLHTPLMSGTNAIHGIVMLGGVLVLATADGPLLIALGFLSVVLGAMNLFGGFVVTDRMLEMFKKKPAAKRPGTPS
jgi:NAD(P) transhydrogenase subunit alpha